MKPKRLPRLWCALQGLLPLEACLAAQRGELAWPRGAEETPETLKVAVPGRFARVEAAPRSRRACARAVGGAGLRP